MLPFHTVHGVLRARILKWFAIPFSSGPHCTGDRDQDQPIEKKFKKKDSRLEKKKYNSHCLQMILYIENPKDTTRKLLELLNEL